MALSEVTVNIGSSGLGRRLATRDGISGIVFYNNTLPSGFSVTERVKKVFSLDEAEVLGIAEGSADHDVEQYHISEFFRQNPSGELWIGYFPVPVSTYDYAEVETMQTTAKGEINLFGVYAPSVEFSSSEPIALQNQLDILANRNEPCRAFLANNLATFSDLTALPDIRSLSAPRVSVRAGQDNAGRGASIFASQSTSVTDLGAILGAEASSLVSQSIGNPELFNLSGVELTVPGYANGQPFRAVSLTQAGAIKDKGYGIIRDRLPGIAGTYSERVPMAVAANSDFAFIENARVVDKAQRILVTVYAPKLNSTVLLNSDGTLSNFAIESFKSIGEAQLEQMVANGDISNYRIEIDPNQNVLATSTLTISALILPLGIAEFIKININLVPELT